MELLMADPPEGKRKKIRHGDVTVRIPLRGDIISIGRTSIPNTYLIESANTERFKGFPLASIGEIDCIPGLNLNRSDYKISEYAMCDAETHVRIHRHTMVVTDDVIPTILDLGSYDEQQDRIKRQGIVWVVITGPDTEYDNNYEGVTSMGIETFATERKARRYVLKEVNEELAAATNSGEYIVEFSQRKVDFVRVYGGGQYEIRIQLIK